MIQNNLKILMKRQLGITLVLNRSKKVKIIIIIAAIIIILAGVAGYFVGKSVSKPTTVRTLHQ